VPTSVNTVGNKTTRKNALLQLASSTQHKNYILNQLIRNKTKNNKNKLNAIVNSIQKLNPGSQAAQYMILRGRSGKNPNRAQQKLNRAARPNRGNLWTALEVPSNENKNKKLLLNFMKSFYPDPPLPNTASNQNIINRLKILKRRNPPQFETYIKNPRFKRVKPNLNKIK